jgi:hypothetical protein
LTRFCGHRLADQLPDRQAHDLIRAFLIRRRFGPAITAAMAGVTQAGTPPAIEAVARTDRLSRRSASRADHFNIHSGLDIALFSEARETLAQTRKTDHRISNFHSGEFDQLPMLQAIEILSPTRRQWQAAIIRLFPNNPPQSAPRRARGARRQ